ncbi:MAG TPA: peptidase M61, partial [Candidatus Accumulibacter sp.]|nr:peptidase M61 [Accumulibacter sp.]
MQPAPIRYSIVPSKPAAHLLEVRCTLPEPAGEGQRFALPAWIPGSYLIRDFARHILAIRAESGGQPVALRKLDKHTWQAAPIAGGRDLCVIYEVYAWDLSVRGAHVDQTHAFFNGSNVFLRAIGH